MTQSLTATTPTQRIMTINSRQKKRSTKRGPSQEELVNAVWAEFDEDMLFLGPRLFDDEYYDNTIALDLTQLKRKKRGNNAHNKGR